jgi:hypothetical protein
MPRGGRVALESAGRDGRRRIPLRLLDGFTQPNGALGIVTRRRLRPGSQRGGHDDRPHQHEQRMHTLHRILHGPS